MCTRRRFLATVSLAGAASVVWMSHISHPPVLMTVLAAHVGLDPITDIHWVTDPSIQPIELFVQGKIDAFLGFPPEPQDLRARQIGHVIVNTAVDRPWSQY